MVTAAQSVVESPQKVVESNFLAAARRLRVDPELVTRLQMPAREVSVSLPIHKKTGEVVIVECMRVLHSNARGPALGGMQMHQPTDELIVGPMAFSNTLAAAVAGVPFGGSYGAFCCNLSELSHDEREQLALGYAARMEPIFGAYRDVYAKSEASPILNLMLNSDKIDASSGEVCGKPLERGGLLDPKLAENALPALIQQLVGKFSHRRERLHVVVVGDFQRGVPIAQTLRTAKMQVIAATNDRSQDDLLRLQCDVLIYCGDSCSLTPARASEVRAQVVLEASAIAVTPSAENALRSRGCEVVPDLLVRAPEFITAHLEWSQCVEGTQYSETRLRETMSARIAKTCSRVLDRAEERMLTVREAAYEIAVEQLARCEALRAAA